LEEKYAAGLACISQRFTAPAYWSDILAMALEEGRAGQEKHRALATSLSRDIEQPFRFVIDQLSSRQFQVYKYID